MSRRLLPTLLPILLVALAALPAAADNGETLILQQPAVSKTHVVFVYAQDLWVVPRTGGMARRLTSHVGSEFRPRISPDGTQVAFTAAYEGNTDVYLIPIDGGRPRRLTWHPGPDVVQDWHPDGKQILFSSRRQGGTPTYRLYHVRPQGGMPEALAPPKVYHASYSDDGKRIAYTPVSDAFRSWKRYRGGRTTPVWIYDPATHAVEQIPHVNATDTYPCWAGGDVFFASDRGGVMNVWRYKPGTKRPIQVTRYTDFDVRSLSAGGGVVAYAHAGALHLLSPDSATPQRLSITVPHDGLESRPSWKAVKGFVEAAAISPNGKRAVFGARGEIITLPQTSGDARNLTESPGAHDRYPIWSPDGQQIAYLSDVSGEYRLVVRDRLGRQKGRSYDLGPGGFYYEPVWSPDGRHVAFHAKTGRVAYVTLSTGEVTTVDRQVGSLGVVWPETTWSPDSKWIAYSKRNPRTLYGQVALYELQSKRRKVITDAFGAAVNPAFSADGKYLYFAASVNSGPRRFGLDMSTSAAKRHSYNVYVVVLRRDLPNPLAPESDEGVTAKKPTPTPKNKPDPKVTKAPEGRPSIDLRSIDQRILALPIPAGRYYQLGCTKNHLLLVEQTDGGWVLKKFDQKSRKATQLRAGVNGFAVAADGKHLLLREGRAWAVMSDDGRSHKRLAIEGVRVRLDPPLEWAQMLREAWRLQRDYFYDANMHGVDWPKMWDRWKQFLPHVRHRADLNLLIAEMIGELCCGHNYVYGGDVPKTPAGASVGLLGADFAIDGPRFKITRIYRGQNWNPGLRAPLTEPGVTARVGWHLLSVNGRTVSSTDNLYAAFENLAGKQVSLVLSPPGGPPRTMTVVPLSSDTRLRAQAWIEERRRMVKKLSRGKLGYIYMPDTGGRGMAAFDRDFYSQVDKAGLVIDERYNRGGKVADYVIDVLSRKVMCYWMNREQWLGRTPFGSNEGPKVMIVNESAGSGGDAMPWLFRRHGLGPLVGTRTWGGLVGISGYPALIDGGRVTAASFGVMDTKGDWAVENEGVAPDHEVIEWPKDMIAGRDPQLEKAVSLALEALKKRTPRKLPTYKPPAKR